MSFLPKLSAFEGPLDLLVHLIEKNKIDIYDIPIAEITDQYMEYLDNADTDDTDFLSEFLVMAATLIEIKAKMLLPAEDEAEEEDDPREELVKQLLEYKLYKYMSGSLKEMEQAAPKSMYRQQQLPDDIASYVPPVDYDLLLEDVTPEKLSAFFSQAMMRYEASLNKEAKQYGKIRKEPVSLPRRMDEIRQCVRENKKCGFLSLIEERPDKENIIVTFLAVLELMKSGDITGKQVKEDIEFIWTGQN